MMKRLDWVSQDLDVKQDANYGWLKDFEDRDHLMLHVEGIPHDY